MNNYQLIQHIKIRRALWDKALWDRIDGSAREVMWGDVAEQMKTSKEIVKARWKNLRDSYRKLLFKSLEQSQSEDIHPKWRYFQHLDFIKDIVLSTKSKVSDISLKNAEMVSIEPDYSVTLETSLSDTAEDPLSFHNDLDSISNVSTSNNSNHLNELKVEKGLKRKLPDGIEIEVVEKPDIHEKPNIVYSNDDDVQFLLSLHPHFKQVPMHKKLLLRMKIERLIHDEVYFPEDM
ncbi:hypothetical protein ILUMI_22735 [Ignelater luminosus]|uniref:Transcription factor Adf-1 n=1 Tax=Ignelater luminosus TaxID=2038154 RepID=A0A8K0FX97_IGNLU|nr:hypothetical protein ILUMI_22735 [Ignelater luminosus]